MESAGAVFLPATGYREAASMTAAGTRGSYWSSSPYPSDVKQAYGMFFNKNGLFTTEYTWRYLGFSVRLVHDVE